MTGLDHRALIAGSLASVLAGCGPDNSAIVASAPTPVASVPTKPVAVAALDPKYSALYQPMPNDKFPVPGVTPAVVRKGFERKEVAYVSSQPVGTIVVDPPGHYLYLIEPNGKAMRYGVGVGKQGFIWSGEAVIKTKQEWPDWYPPKEMIDRHPELKPQLDKLRSGQGVAGGLRNPLGARAMYLWQGNKDTYFRIHGTLEPHSIGTNASSGCIRMINQDAIDLYSRVSEGTKVVVLGNAQPTIGVAKPPARPKHEAPKQADSSPGSKAAS